MATRITTPFVTAKDAAKRLGVSRSRFKRLMKLINFGPATAFMDDSKIKIYKVRHRTGKAPRFAYYNKYAFFSKQKQASGSLKRTASKRVAASRRKLARVKPSKSIA